MKTKKRTALSILSLLLALLLLTACMPANPEDPTTEPTTEPTAEPTTAPTTEPTAGYVATPPDLETEATEPRDPIGDPFASTKVSTPFDDLVVTADAPRDAEELMMAPEDMPTAAQPDFMPMAAYESSERLVFVNCSGVFVYDLTQEKIIYSFDFMKVFGLNLTQQGGGGSVTRISQDGQRMIVGYGAIGAGAWNEENGCYDDWFSECYYIDLEAGTYYKAPFEEMEDRYVIEEGGGWNIISTTVHGPWIYYPNYPDKETSYDLFAEYMDPEDYEPTPAEP